MIIASARMGSGLLLAAGLCMGPASPAITQMPQPDAARSRSGPRFDQSEFVDRVGVDVLTDEIEMPAALEHTSILMDEAQTELPFQVYAVASDPRFYVRLADYPRQVSTRVVGAGGRDPLRVRVRFTEEGGEPRWVMRVLRRPRRGRTVILTVTFQCGVPRTTFRTSLFVSVPGRLPRQGIARPESRPRHPRPFCGGADLGAARVAATRPI